MGQPQRLIAKNASIHFWHEAVSGQRAKIDSFLYLRASTGHRQKGERREARREKTYTLIAFERATASYPRSWLGRVDILFFYLRHRVANVLLADLRRLVLKPRGLPPMPSATYFFSTAKKSRRAGYNCPSSSKMPLSNAERLAQRKTLL